MDFTHSENGAVTVDWVVLTAGLVGLGLAVMSVVSTGVQDTSGDIESQLTGQQISSSFRGLTGWEYTELNSGNYNDYLVQHWPTFGGDEAAYQAAMDEQAAEMEAGLARIAANGPGDVLGTSGFEEAYDAYAAGIDHAAQNGISVTATYDDLYDMQNRYAEARAE